MIMGNGQEKMQVFSYAELGASCFSPEIFSNSDGDSETFFRVKNYQENFLP